MASFKRADITVLQVILWGFLLLARHFRWQKTAKSILQELAPLI